MITDEMRQFFAKPLIARLATVNPDGYPHLVPLWYEIVGDEAYMMTDRTSRKAKNASANPKASLCVGGQPGDGLGYTLWGDCIVETDVDHVWTNRLCYRYLPNDEAEKLIDLWKDDDVVYIRMKIKRVVKVWEG